MNVTVGLPKAANEFDRPLEGNRDKAGTGELNSRYARQSLEIINLVSQGKIGPIEGINRFVVILEQFYSDMEKSYLTERTTLSPPEAKKLIHEYERDAILFLKGRSKKFIRRDYIEMSLGIMPSEREQLSKKPELRSQMYRQKYEKIAQQILGARYSSVSRDMPLAETINEEIEIAQPKPTAELFLPIPEDSYITPKKAQPTMPVKLLLSPSSAPLPKAKEEKRIQAPATAPRLAPNPIDPLNSDSPYIPHLIKLTASKKTIFEKLPWKFSGTQVYSDPYYMGVDHGWAIVQTLKEMRRIALELLLGHLLDLGLSTPLKVEDWHIVKNILDYAEPPGQYIQSLLLGEPSNEELEATLVQQVEKILEEEADSDFLTEVLRLTFYAKIIYENLPTKYSNIASGYASPYYLGAPVGDDIVAFLADIEETCNTFVAKFTDRMPLIAVIINCIFSGAHLEWGLIDTILEYLGQIPTRDAEELEERLGIAYQPVEGQLAIAKPDEADGSFVTPVKVATLAADDSEELPLDTKRSQPLPRPIQYSSYAEVTKGIGATTTKKELKEESSVGLVAYSGSSYASMSSSTLYSRTAPGVSSSLSSSTSASSVPEPRGELSYEDWDDEHDEEDSPSNFWG